MKITSKLALVLSIVIIYSCSSTKKSFDSTSREELSTEKDMNERSSSKDGSSVEEAIVVNNIDEEYEYVRKVCPECQFTMQALIFIKKKPYDVLSFKKDNGETVDYYFDISKFFGKW